MKSKNNWSALGIILLSITFASAGISTGVSGSSGEDSPRSNRSQNHSDGGRSIENNHRNVNSSNSRGQASSDTPTVQDTQTPPTTITSNSNSDGETSSNTGSDQVTATQDSNSDSGGQTDSNIQSVQDNQTQPVVQSNFSNNSGGSFDDGRGDGHDSHNPSLVLLNKLLSDTAKSKKQVQHSNLSDDQKTQLITSFDALIDLIKQDISHIGGSGDNSPPVTSAFSVGAITSTGAIISATTNKPGQAYFVVLPGGSAAPTSAQVKLGQDASGATVVLNDNGPSAAEPDQFPVYNLTPNTSYTLYFVVQDLSGNLSSTPQSASFTTLSTGGGGGGDVTPPIISALSTTGTTNTMTTAMFSSNESGTGYYVVLASGSTIPTAAQVKLGQDSSGATASVQGFMPMVTGMNQFNVTGLSPSTAYVLYFVAQDMSANLTVSPVSTAFMTLANGGGGGDVTPPIILDLSTTGTTNSMTTAMFSSNESGTGYYVVLSGGALSPTAAQVKLGQDSSGVTASVQGSMAMVTGMNQSNVTGLSPSTAYVLYFVAQDMSANLSVSPISVAFMTLASGGGGDVTPPVISNPLINNITTTGATFAFSSNESATGYIVVLASGATAPTSAQVILGQDASSTGAFLTGSGEVTIGANTADFTDLDPNTAYTLYFVAKDASGNFSPSPLSVTFSTLATGGGDTTPPVISNLALTGTTSTGSIGSFSSDENGTFYYVVLDSGALAPSTAQVKLGQDAASTAALLAGTGTMLSGTTQFALSGLTPVTSYTLYLVAQDTSANSSSAPMNVSFTTLSSGGGVDTVPPIISSFSATGTTTTTTDLAATVDKSGTGYYVILPSAITLSQITPHNTASDCWSAINGNVYNLTSFISSHPGGNAILVICGTDGSATFNAIHPTATELALVATLKIGTFGSVLPTPTATQVQAGQDSTGVLAAINGGNPTSVGANLFPVAGLTTKQNYTTFFTASNMNGNLQPVVSMANFITN